MNINFSAVCPKPCIIHIKPFSSTGIFRERDTNRTLKAREIYVLQHQRPENFENRKLSVICWNFYVHSKMRNYLWLITLAGYTSIAFFIKPALQKAIYIQIFTSKSIQTCLFLNCFPLSYIAEEVRCRSVSTVLEPVTNTWNYHYCRLMQKNCNLLIIGKIIFGRM